MKRFALVLPVILGLSGCNTDGFEELQSVYSENHKGETYVNTVPNTPPSTTPTDSSTNNGAAFCKSLTARTCQEIRNNLTVQQINYKDFSMACVEANQQQNCFLQGNRDKIGAIFFTKDENNDGILCNKEFNDTCKFVKQNTSK